MKKTIFKGVATAIITPFNENGIDYDAFAKHIDWQIDEGLDGIVVCGTTGETSTLGDDEHRAAVDFAVKHVNGRIPVIAGVGSNDTAYSKDLIRCAEMSGADAMLAVTPYYNKATQNGLIEIFTQYADASAKPIILYNVPSRTGVNIEPETYKVLADHENIVGIKEANGDIGKIVETMSYVDGKLDLYSGNDNMITPLLSLGGAGVISVLSNIMPAQTKAMCTKYFEGDVYGSYQLQIQLHDLITALFSEVNPIPVKAAVAAMGFCEDRLRLPLTSMEPAHRKVLLDEMRKQGLKVDEGVFK